MSQQFLLPCTCGQMVRVSNAQAGGQVSCGCGKTLTVPTLRGLRQLQSAPVEATAKRPLGWSPVHGAAFASGLAAVAIGMVLIAFYLLRYAQVSGWTIDRSDQIVAHEATQIEKLTPVQMLAEWTKLLEEGLGEQGKPIWVTAKERATTYAGWIKIGAVSLVAGALLAVATLFVGRRAG